MPIVTRQEALSTTAELLVTSKGSLRDPQLVKVRNDDAAISVFVGGPGVTSATGWEIAPTASQDFVLGPSDHLYAVAASGTPTVHVFETRS